MIKIIKKMIYYKELFNTDDLIIVYQMGKVGSSTIVNSLEKMNVPTFHVHSFIDDIDKLTYSNYKFYRKIKYPTMRDYIKSYFISKYIAYLAKKRIQQKKVKIISLVREPISRNISKYFHSLIFPIYELYAQNLVTGRHTSNDYLGLEYFINDFFENFDQDYCLNWFDKEFRKFTNIDIYKHSFNKEKGYKRIQEGNIDLMLIKLEKLKDIKSVLASFIGKNNFDIVNENTSSIKWYSPLYSTFKQEIEFTDDYIEKIYNSKMVKHFYSDDEINIFRKKLKEPKINTFNT